LVRSTGWSMPRSVDVVRSCHCRCPRTTGARSRDQAYWMTRRRLVFDVYVEEYAVHRVMRQFGLFQEAPVLLCHVCRLARTGELPFDSSKYFPLRILNCQ
jgi:hypothetical protein